MSVCLLPKMANTQTDRQTDMYIYTCVNVYYISYAGVHLCEGVGRQSGSLKVRVSRKSFWSSRSSTLKDSVGLFCAKWCQMDKITSSRRWVDGGEKVHGQIKLNLVETHFGKIGR